MPRLKKPGLGIVLKIPRIKSQPKRKRQQDETPTKVVRSVVIPPKR